MSSSTSSILIIFDRYSRRGVIPQAYLENVARYVRNGRRLSRSGRPELWHADEPLPHPARSDLAGRADRKYLSRKASRPAADRSRPPPSGDRGPPRGRRTGRRPDLGSLVPPGRFARPSRHDGDERRSRRPAARARPRRAGARGAAAFRPDVVLGARLRGRRAAGGVAAPARLLADEGARSRGERSAR